LANCIHLLQSPGRGIQPWPDRITDFLKAKNTSLEAAA